MHAQSCPQLRANPPSTAQLLTHIHTPSHSHSHPHPYTPAGVSSCIQVCISSLRGYPCFALALSRLLASALACLVRAQDIVAEHLGGDEQHTPRHSCPTADGPVHLCRGSQASLLPKRQPRHTPGSNRPARADYI
eukprot:1133671-Pelagomonas_calceolata.AAC.23